MPDSDSKRRDTRSSLGNGVCLCLFKTFYSTNELFQIELITGIALRNKIKLYNVNLQQLAIPQFSFIQNELQQRRPNRSICLDKGKEL